MSHAKLRRMLLCAIFAAFLCLLSPVVVPVGPVPFAMQIFAVMLCAVTLDWFSAQTAVLVYLLLGLFLPLFSGGNTGAAALAGPTGGYLWSYLLMVPVICLFCAIPVKRRRSAYALALLGCLPALGLCYLCGTLQFCFVTGTGFRRALSLCVAPFVGFDLLKALAASLLGVELRRRLARLWT
jgi:Uncharacterized conserved protein